MGYKLQLARLRKARGMTQRDFSKASGVPLGTLRGWEQGVADVPLDAACKCAEALGCDVNELCGWYLDHPHDTSAAPSAESDPMARELIDCYESLNPDGQTNLLGVARGLHSLPEWRAGDGRRGVEAQGRVSA